MIAPDFKPVLRRADMRRLDAATIAGGTPSLELMERAGAALCAHMRALRIRPATPIAQPTLLVLAGPGNNGGDGLVVARMLSAEGWAVTVALCGAEPKPDSDAGVNLQRYRSAGGGFTAPEQVFARLQAPNPPWDLALDSLYGTGLDRPLTGVIVEMIRALTTSGLQTVAADIPSGLCADSGRLLGAAVVADTTVAIGAAKPGLFVGLGPDHAGRVSVVDIGLADPEGVGIEPVGQMLDRDTCAYWLPMRRRTIHKGDLGHVLVMGAQRGKSGAVLLAARGALRAGAGLVTMAVPERLVETTDAALAEAMTLGLPQADDGSFAEEAWSAFGRDSGRFSVAAVGPGMGTGPGAREIVLGLLSDFAGPLVIDADALNVLAAVRDRLPQILSRRRARSQGPVIMTPHPGEMARLLATTSAAIQDHRLGAARTFCDNHAATLVLKGAGTIVAEGRRTAFNTSGNPGMASPGMGDVLTGIAAAFAARVKDPYTAACLAVHVHGLAADVRAQLSHGPGYLASEVADSVPGALALLGASVQ